jgi:hypothetical protein
MAKLSVQLSKMAVSNQAVATVTLDCVSRIDTVTAVVSQNPPVWYFTLELGRLGHL